MLEHSVFIVGVAHVEIPERMFSAKICTVHMVKMMLPPGLAIGYGV